MTFQRAAFDTLILYFGSTIDPETHTRVMACHDQLTGHLHHGIRSLIPSYASLLVQYDPLKWEEKALKTFLSEISKEETASHTTQAPTFTIPVWYDPSVGWDLERLATLHRMSIEEVIQHHHTLTYRVYAVGFMPGFGYMGEIDQRIATPRLTTPRSSIPAGSVAIADRQTAVYPAASPGGWNILGRTPLRLFDPYHEPASLLQVGLKIRFEPIERDRYLELGGTV
jgi:KipI family sensor histidine kinase inhibitor